MVESGWVPKQVLFRGFDEVGQEGVKKIVVVRARRAEKIGPRPEDVDVVDAFNRRVFHLANHINWHKKPRR